MNYTKHIFKGGDILLAGELNDMSAALEALSTSIIASSETMVSLIPDNNSEYRYGELSSLTITLPSNLPDDYAAWLVFSTGTSPTAADYPDTIKWSGDEVVDEIFTPTVNRLYNVALWYDGININGAVRGVNL